MLVWNSAGAQDLLVFLLILWATTGLTIIHLAVLALRGPGRLARRLLARRQPPAAPASDAPLPNLSLTFVVPVYNEELTVGPCVESILRQSVRPKSIIVVNDGSTDRTLAALEPYRDQGVLVLTTPRNAGKTRALEHALQYATTDLVAITDADSIVHTDYVKNILESFRDPEVVAVGGAVESIPHTWVTAARQIEYMMTVNIDRNAETSMNSLVVLPGVSTTYRRDTLLEMGFQHDTIAEDFDLTFRLQRANKKISMNLKAKVYTSDPPTLKSYARQLHRWYTDFWLVIRKHRQVLGKRVFGTVEVPMLLLNATVSSLLYLVLPVYLLLFEPSKLLWFFGLSLLMDLALIALAARIYRRHDVWWSLASRVPTRFIGRTAFLVAMVRVLVGKPGLAWKKLERRGTQAFLQTHRKAGAAQGQR